MATLSPRLRRLDAALADLDADSEAMLLSELDGYVAGVLVSPETIPPDEWLPVVWGPPNDAAELFVDDDDAAWFAAQVIGHHDAVAAILHRGKGRYAPVFDVDRRHDEVLWEIWIEGFTKAMALRPAAWESMLASGDDDATAAFGAIATLVDIARDESDLDRPAIDELTEDAPDLIATCVEALHRWRAAHAASPAAAPRPAAIGRNDPCPCGSGKKYKKCCRAD